MGGGLALLSKNDIYEIFYNDFIYLKKNNKNKIIFKNKFKIKKNKFKIKKKYFYKKNKFYILDNM